MRALDCVDKPKILVAYLFGGV